MQMKKLTEDLQAPDYAWEIGRIRLRTTIPLLCDQYRRNRTTGGFILIDETTNRTVGAGMIIEAN